MIRLLCMLIIELNDLFSDAIAAADLHQQPVQPVGHLNHRVSRQTAVHSPQVIHTYIYNISKDRLHRLVGRYI